MAPSSFPAVALENDAPASQRDALLLEADTLCQHPGFAAPAADPALRIDHAMPRHIVGTAAHRAADGAGGSRGPHACRHLAVGHDGALRDAPHEAIDLTLKAQSRRAPSELTAVGVAIVSSQSRAYRSPRRSSSACVPSSCTRPRCRTRIRSACCTVESRCAIVILVRPTRSRCIASRILHSDSGSTLEVASSRTRIAGLYTRARAMASSWRCPCERFAPRSPSGSSSPRGSASTNARAYAASSARRMASTGTSAPRAMLSATVPVKSTVSWKTVPTRRRRRSRSHSRTSTSSTSTRPRVTSYERISRRAHVDLPSPVAPTSATCSPVATRNEQSRRTSCSPVYENQTEEKSIVAFCERAERACGATCASLRPPSVRIGLADPATTDTIAGARSSSPKMRSAEAMAACITVYLAPRSRIGRKKRLVYWMKATSAPNESAPAPIWPPPYQISSASATEPSASTDAY